MFSEPSLAALYDLFCPWEARGDFSFYLPLVMSATFTMFPSGLVLYYVVNTGLTIAQQWNINRRIEAAAKPRN